MSINLIFTNKTGPGSTFTLFDSEQDAIDAAGNFVWTKIRATSPSPWVLIPYPGFDGYDAKHMGGKPHVIEITGFVTAATQAELWTAVDTLLNQNKGKSTFALSGPVTSASGDGVILDIIADIHGENAVNWPFVIAFTNLAT